MFLDTDAREGCAHDAIVTLRGPTTTTRFFARVRRRIRPSTVEPLIAETVARAASDDGSPMLCTEHVSAAVGARLRDAGIAYVDASGNAHVVTPDVHVHIEGVAAKARDHRLPGRPDKSPLARPHGLRVIHELLRDPGLVRATTRRLAEAAGVGQRSAARVLRELEAEGWIRIDGRRRRAFRLGVLHRRWIDGYLDVLRPTLRPARMSPVGRDSTVALAAVKDEFGEKYRALYGGPMAARHLGADLRSDELTVHVPPEHRDELAAAMRLRPDPGGPVTFLDPIGDTTRPHDDNLMADALDVHAELLVDSDERLARAAAFLLESELETRWLDA